MIASIIISNTIFFFHFTSLAWRVKNSKLNSAILLLKLGNCNFELKIFYWICYFMVEWLNFESNLTFTRRNSTRKFLKHWTSSQLPLKHKFVLKNSCAIYEIQEWRQFHAPRLDLAKCWTRVKVSNQQIFLFLCKRFEFDGILERWEMVTTTQNPRVISCYLVF